VSKSAAPFERERHSAPEALDTERIRCRAYEIFLGRNGEPDDPLADWVQAERELRGEARGYPPPIAPSQQDTIRGASGGGASPRSERRASIHD
jgi:hypothetical protein